MHHDLLPKGTIAARVLQQTGVSPLACYQCGCCAAGCPQNVPGEMDISPTRVMRLLQLEAAFAGDETRSDDYARRALSAETPWLCAGCLACSTRCPQGVDIAGVMDVLRQEAILRGCACTSARARAIQAQHAIMLAIALKQRRVHELSLVARLKLRTGRFFGDAILGTEMLVKGKLSLLPPRTPDGTRVRRAVEKFREQDRDV